MGGLARLRLAVLMLAGLCSVPATAQVVDPARDAVRRGMAHHRAGKLREALVEYTKARELDRSWAEPLRLIGLVLRAEGKLNEAIASYRSALVLDPQSAEAHNDLGVALRMRGDLAGALESFQKAVQNDPKFVQAQYNIASILYDQNKLSEAMEALAATLRLDPKYAPAHYNTAVILGRQGRWPQALKSAERAYQLQPSEPRNWLFAAWCHYQIGEMERAAELARKGVEKDPKRADAHYLVGFVETARNNLDAALAAYDVGLRLDRKAPLTRAIEDLRRELAPDATVPSAHYALGYLLQAQENRADAAAAYEQYLRVAKAGKWTERAKEALALLK